MRVASTAIVSVFVSAVVLTAVTVMSQEAKSDGVAMRKKLQYSQQILAGLVNEDFDKILKSAEALNQFGKQKWIDNESAAYRTQNQVFWFTAGTLVMAAEEKNIDGATLAYTQMTHACVNCHKVLRRQ